MRGGCAVNAAGMNRASAQVRGERADLRRRVRQGWSLATMIGSLDMHPALAGARLDDVVRWLPRVGPYRAERMLLGLPARLPLSEATLEQRALLQIRVRNHERKLAGYTGGEPDA
jgi:hypothetical protein